MNERISIVIAGFNCEKTIERCLQSLMNQKYTNYECIFVDDGSTDNTSELVRKICEKENRIKYIYKENGGAASARNKGILAAEGDWITFLDADDCLEKDALSIIAREINEDIDVVLFNCIVIEKNKMSKNFFVPFEGDETTIIKEGDIHLLKLQGISPKVEKPGIAQYMHCCTSWGKLYRRSILASGQLLFDETLDIGEDLLFTLHCFDKAQSIAAIQDCLYYYYINETSLTHKVDNRITEKYLQLYKKLNAYVKSNYANNEAYINRMGWFLVETLHIILLNYMRSDRIKEDQLSILSEIYDNTEAKMYLNSINNRDNRIKARQKNAYMDFAFAINYDENRVVAYVQYQRIREKIKRRIKNMMRR